MTVIRCTNNLQFKSETSSWSQHSLYNVKIKMVGVVDIENTTFNNI